MQRLADIERKIVSLSGLLDVIGAMRALAAARVQEAREASAGVERHAEIVRDALSSALRLLEPEEQTAPEVLSTLVVVFASEHGFAGAFNERVLDKAASVLVCPADRLFVVGTRGAMLADERKLSMLGTLPMATHVQGILELARRVAESVAALIVQHGFDAVAVVNGASVGGASFDVTFRRVLPIERTPVATNAEPPLVNLSPLRLLEKLSDELVFAELMRAAIASFAGENTARLAAMEAAHGNIETKLEALQVEAGQRRQNEITSELLDIVTGAEAMKE